LSRHFSKIFFFPRQFFSLTPGGLSSRNAQKISEKKIEKPVDGARSFA